MTAARRFVPGPVTPRTPGMADRGAGIDPSVQNLWGLTRRRALDFGLGLLTHPGRNSSVDAAAAGVPGTTGSWWDFLTGLVPGNILGLQAAANDDGSIGLSFNVLQLIVLAVAIGVAALKVGEAA